MAEESKIIEQVVSETEEKQTQSTEKTPEFDVSAFTGYEKDKKGNALEKEAVQEAKQEESEPEKQDVKQEDTPEPEQQVEKEDGFSWEDVKQDEVKEEKKPEAKEEEVDWDTENVEPTKQEVKTPEFDWNEMGKEFNVTASNKDEFVKGVKEMLNNPVSDNDVISNLKDYLKLEDKEIVIADLKAAGYEDDYISDTVERMQDAGLLKREATTIRHQLNKHIVSEKQRLQKQAKDKKLQEEQTAVKSRKDLQKLIKSKNEFFGGKVSQQEKKSLYNYITKGNFAEDIFSNHANVADAAFLWRNKDKIFKMIRTQGVEQGKSTVLNGITSPSRNEKNTMNYSPKSKGFNPSEFIKK
jgi:hypothetical protein